MTPTQKQLVHDLATLMNDVPNHRREAAKPLIARMLALVDLKLSDCAYLVERRPLAFMKRHLNPTPPPAPRSVFFQLYDEHGGSCYAEGYTTIEELGALLRYKPRTMQNYLYAAQKTKQRSQPNVWNFQYGKPLREDFQVYATLALSRPARDEDLTLAQGLERLPVKQLIVKSKLVRPHRSQGA